MPAPARAATTGSRRSWLAGYAAVWAALAASGCTTTLELDDALTAVPYRVEDDGRLVIDVTANGQGPFAFAIDTAASISFIAEDVREVFGLPEDPAAKATVHGLVTTGQFPVHVLERIGVGSEQWTAARLVSVPRATAATSRIDGALGMDFLARYGLAFSRNEGVVRLYTPEQIRARAYRGWASVPMQRRPVGDTGETLLFVDIAIGERSVSALLDLGLGVNVLNSEAARALELRLARATTASSRLGRLAGVVGTEPVLARLDEEAVWTGTVRWRREMFLISDLEVFEILGSLDEPLAIVGSGLFNQRDFVIDPAGDRLLIRTNMAEIDTLP